MLIDLNLLKIQYLLKEIYLLSYFPKILMLIDLNFAMN